MAVSRVTMSLTTENIQIHTGTDRRKTMEHRAEHSGPHSHNPSQSNPNRLQIMDSLHNFIGETN